MNKKKLMMNTLLIVVMIAAITIILLLTNLPESYRAEPVKFQIDETNTDHVEISCYPILSGGDYKVTDKEKISELLKLVNNKKFTYWGTVNKRNKKSGNGGGGYDSWFNFYDKENKLLGSFGYDFICEDYYIKIGDGLYVTEWDDVLNSYCDGLIQEGRTDE